MTKKFFSIINHTIEIKGNQLISKENIEESGFSEKKLYYRCVLNNFYYIEDNDVFYDAEDQYGNNYFFKDTPQGIFMTHFPSIKWRTPQEVRKVNFKKLNVQNMKDILELQRKIINKIFDVSQKQNKLFKFYYIKEYEYAKLSC